MLNMTKQRRKIHAWTLCKRKGYHAATMRIGKTHDGIGGSFLSLCQGGLGFRILRNSEAMLNFGIVNNRLPQLRQLVGGISDTGAKEGNIMAMRVNES